MQLKDDFGCKDEARPERVDSIEEKIDEERRSQLHDCR
jgi:hypothetical protein